MSLLRSLTLVSTLVLFFVQPTFGRDLHVVNKVISPDGFSRDAVLAEGVFPGPPIQGLMGDTFTLNVINQLQDKSMLEATSIHWHGLFQHASSWADGPASVTQCPIMPKNSFTYNFTVPNQAGTFWYHSHYSTQYCDGLRGPFVVYDLFDPLAYLYDQDDASTIITLADWYHTPAPILNNIPDFYPNSTLINGQGRYFNATDNSVHGALSVVTVQPGRRYRFRLVSLSCDPAYTFSIDGHNLTVIEADGVETAPLTVQQLQIYAGQRYSVVVTASATVDNYWIRANPSRGLTGFNNGINSGILRYAGAPVSEPTSKSIPGRMLNEWELTPYDFNPPPPVDKNETYTMAVGFDDAAGRFTLNGASFNTGTFSVPVLLQILNGVPPNQLMPNGSIYNLPKNKTIELQFTGAQDHPFHLHGHNFWVIQSAGQLDGHIPLNPLPVLRDVVNAGASTNDVVRIRFRTDNAGPWFLHCHIDWHLELGLAAVMVEDIGDIPQVKPPASYFDLCKVFVPGT